jgi:hypothetical protein
MLELFFFKYSSIHFLKNIYLKKLDENNKKKDNIKIKMN